MATAEELRRQIDLHDLADRLGLDRPDHAGNYRSPEHDDKNPSLSIYEGRNGQPQWKDFSTDQGGSCIDLVMYCQGVDFTEAMRWLHESYGIPHTPRDPINTRREPRSWAEDLADICLKGDKTPALEYLRGRGIDVEILQQAVAARALGFNDYRSTKKAEGKIGHGGPGVAFVVRRWSDDRVVAVDQRYLDPALNGGVKANSQGDKSGYPWYLSRANITNAHTVYIIESPINGLSVLSCGLKGAVGVVATRGVAVAEIDWSFLRGKKVRICMDHDEPDKHNKCPGREVAWQVYDQLVDLRIPAMLIDQDDWEENDSNDILVNHGADELRMALQRIDHWLFPGQTGEKEKRRGRARVFLPAQDLVPYWKFRVKDDFVTWIDKIVREEGPDGQKHEKVIFADVCGFRVADMSAIRIQGAEATLTGDKDHSPTKAYAVTVQTALDDRELERRVLAADEVHAMDHWKKFGPIYKPTAFARMMNVIYRSADTSPRDAANFVGLCWRDGKLAVNEGPDTYFSDPDQQCPYSKMIFPRGTTLDARTVVAAYQQTFTHNAALIPLVWFLGAHLKALLGFWPHLTMPAEKGTGKSTLVEHMQRTVAFTIFGGESLKTTYRQLTTVSHTSHPIGWDELSTLPKTVIDDAINMLQQTYRKTLTRRGTKQTEFLQCAPAFLVGEEVDADTLTGKLVRTTLLHSRRGPKLPHDLPAFPVYQWLEHLATLKRADVLTRFEQVKEQLALRCMAETGPGSGADRMLENYAAVMVAWGQLCEFAGIKMDQGGFTTDLVSEMNDHIKQTESTRQPWVWIMTSIFNEISAGAYRMPFAVQRDKEDDARLLVIKPAHIMHHMAHSIHLRSTFDALPIKKATSLAQQLHRAGVVKRERLDVTIKGRREHHMMGLDMEALATYQLKVSEPDE